MNVAPHPEDSQINIAEGDFGHAVDNPGDFIGVVVGRPAHERWWRVDSLAARGRRGRVGYQSRYWPPSCLIKYHSL